MKGGLVAVLVICLTACASYQSVDKDNLANLNLEIAMTYLNKGLPVMAKKHFLLALQEDPHNPAVLAGYGLYLEKVGDSQAQNYYQQAIEFNPGSAMAHNNYGTYLCRHEQYAQAIREFQEAIGQSDYLYTAQAYENMGICSDLAKQPVAAKLYFSKALAYDPSLRFSREMLRQLSNADDKHYSEKHSAV